MSDFSNNIKLYPLCGRVLVRVKGNSPNVGTIIVPDTAKNVPMEGFVAAVSEGIYEYGTFRPHSVHIGDHVLFKQNAGVDVTVENDAYRVMNESDIILRIEGVEYG